MSQIKVGTLEGFVWTGKRGKICLSLGYVTIEGTSKFQCGFLQLHV